MFHYNLACARAEKKDMVGAIEELRIAFRNRDTMIKGEPMPDPAKDDSFAPFMSNADFTQFLKELRWPTSLCVMMKSARGNLPFQLAKLIPKPGQWRDWLDFA
jgi:hypothetical protein